MRMQKHKVLPLNPGQGTEQYKALYFKRISSYPGLPYMCVCAIFNVIRTYVNVCVTI